MGDAGLSARVGALAAVVLLVTVVVYGVKEGARGAPLQAEDGSPFALGGSEGIQAATWDGRPVLVFVTTEERLGAVEDVRGEGEATDSLPLGGGLRVFALSAMSTHLGCTVAFRPDLGASRDVADYDGDGLNDGRILDPCHQSQWDAFNRGKVFSGVPARRDLATLELRWENGRLWGLGFDGLVGPQR